MRLKRLCCLMLLAVACNATAQPCDGHLRLVFAGDLMGHMPLHKAAQQPDGSYNYEPCFRYIKDYVESADLAIVNLEVTLAGKPYTGFPCFSSPDAYAAAARDAGFDIFATANNHCVDKGRRGIERTLRILDSLDILHLGTYADEQQRMETYPLIINRNGIRLALLSYTYGTNGIAVPKPNVVNLIDTAQMLQDIKKAQRHGADFIIALMHWGVEYQRHNNREQQRIARWLFDHGCGAVVGAHPHVVQNLAIDANPDNGRYPEPVVYSMGNFFSNQQDEDCNGGIMFELELIKKANATEVYSCAYMPVFVHRAVVGGRRQYRLVPASDALSHPDTYGIAGSELSRLEQFDKATRDLLLGCQGDSKSQYRIMETHFYENAKPAIQNGRPTFYINYGGLFRGVPIKPSVWRKRILLPIRPF
ncbi:MAG: CapA family protein [Bacteroidales bacterium]|nr:CapA family protein [Bacteroidales bacterium]